MKLWVKYIRFAFLITLVIGLFAFTGKRNEGRNIKGVDIEFVQEQNPYINELTVNKLLIQNQVGVTNVGKEIIVLGSVEKALDRHQMIENTDVYLTVKGELKATIKQRTPIARVNSVDPFYIDSNGMMMPLSDNHSAHVPIVANVSEKEVAEVFPLLKFIQEDNFLKQHVVSVTKNPIGDYELDLRVYGFKINFGKIQNIQTKVDNFKAFYQKTTKDQSLNRYSEVNLQYRNQVVCTIK